MNKTSSDPWKGISADLAPHLEHLAYLRTTFPDLLTAVRLRPPSPVEVAAIGYLLHGFYLMAERVCEAVMRAFDEALPQGRDWHQRLLDSVALSTATRPPLITQEMLRSLHKYRSFRHIFRREYPHTLQWELMSPLVNDFNATLIAFKHEVQAFVSLTAKP